MICESCRKEIVPDRMFCIWCNAFVPDHRAGRRAGLVRRFLATLIDPALLTIVFFVAESVAREWYPSPPGIPSDIFDNRPDIIGGFSALAYGVFALVLFFRGQSPGKWILGERVVVRRTGKPAGFWRMVLRESFGKTLSGIFFGLGYLWALWDRDSQAWHDKIAGTLVIHYRGAEEKKEAIASGPSPQGAAPGARKE